MPVQERLLNIVWCLPLGTEKALRRGISIAALHKVWHELRDQRRGGGGGGWQQPAVREPAALTPFPCWAV